MDIVLNRKTEIVICDEIRWVEGTETYINPIWVNDESTVKIEAGSLHLTNAIVDTDIKFGQLISGEFRVTLFNLSQNVTGKYIRVWWIDTTNPASEVSHIMFTGQIESAEHDNVNQHRDIVAYDWAYYHRDMNIADFWNTFWENNKHATTIRLDWFRSQLLDYLDIMGSTGSLYNDDLNIAGKYEKVTVLTFESLLIMISELQCAFPHINASGALDFIKLDNSNTADLRDRKYEGDSSRWEDYTFQPITGIAIWEDSNNMINVIGQNTNPYSISSNLFLLNMERADRDQVCTALLTQMSGYSYIPCSINMIASDLNLELGQRIRTEKGYSYIMSNDIFGSLFVEQTLECRATSGTLKLEGSTYNDNMVNGLKQAKITKDIDSLNIKYTNVTTELGTLESEVDVMAGKIVLQVSNNGQVSGLRLDGTGSQSTFQLTAGQISLDGYEIDLSAQNHITFKSGNFTLDANGNVAVTGSITATSLTLAEGVTIPASKITGLPSTEGFIRVDGTVGNTPAEGSTGFVVENTGLMKASNAIIWGKLYSSEGLIGGITISQNSICSGDFIPYDKVGTYTRYKSIKNHNSNSMLVRATITFKGYTTFAIVIRSESEATFDYVNAGLLDATNIGRDSQRQGTTQNNNNEDVSVTYSCNTNEHTIEVIYTKDGSMHTEPDCGYFYVDEANCVGTGTYSVDTGGHFSVNKDGLLNASHIEVSGTIKASDIIGGSINIGNGTFTVDSSGNMVATSAEIKGDITGDQIIKLRTNASQYFTAQTFNVLDTTVDNVQPGLTVNGPTYSQTQGGTTITDGGKLFEYLPTVEGNTLRFYKNIHLTGNYAFSGAYLMNGTAITSVAYGLLFAGTQGQIVRSNFSANDISGLIDAKVTANPSGTGSTNLTKLQVGSTIYNIPSGGGGSVGQRVDASPGASSLPVTNDTYKSIKRITLSKGTYLIQATVKFKNEADIQVGIGTNNNEIDLQARAYGSDKLSVSRIIVNPNNTDMYVYIGVYCKTVGNFILTGYNYGNVNVNDKTIIEYIKLND